MYLKRRRKIIPDLIKNIFSILYNDLCVNIVKYNKNSYKISLFTF